MLPPDYPHPNIGHSKTFTPEQIRKLEENELTIISDYPTATYVQGNPEFYIMIEGQLPTEKPILIVDGIEGEAPHFNEALEAVKDRTYSVAVMNEHANENYTRSQISEAIRENSDHLPSGVDLPPNVAYTTAHANSGGFKYRSLVLSPLKRHGEVSLYNLPEKISTEMRKMTLLESLYMKLVEQRGKKEENQTVLDSAEQLETAIKSRDGLLQDVKDVLGENVDFEALKNDLLEYRDKFWPDMYRKLLELQEAANQWIESLKIAK